MSLEECPYCGKPFKRLKAHMPYCRLAPAAQPKKSIKAPKDPSATTSRQKIHKKTSATDVNDVIFGERLASKSRKKEDIHNAESPQASATMVKVLSAETLNTERPKSKWLAKRQRELERLQLFVPVSQKPSNSTSLSENEGDKSFCEISKGPVQATSQTNGKSTKGKKKLKMAPLSERLSITESKINSPGFVPAILKYSSLPSECSAQHENPKVKTKVNFLEELERHTNSQNKDFDLVSRAKVLEAHTFFTSKTSVWDHIKDSLYYRRSCNLYVPYPVIETSKESALETKQIPTVQQSHKVAVPSHSLSETSIRQTAEDTLQSRFQSVRSLSGSLEVVTDCNRISFPTVCANKNVWMKDQFAELSQSEVPLVKRNLGDVRLNELGVWLGAQTPVSPKQIVTVIKQGWQWYYRKYIDVRRGGIGGISMLLTGYCVLCYIWNYPHLKRDRWRKYH